MDFAQNIVVILMLLFEKVKAKTNETLIDLELVHPDYVLTIHHTMCSRVVRYLHIVKTLYFQVNFVEISKITCSSKQNLNLRLTKNLLQL